MWTSSYFHKLDSVAFLQTNDSRKEGESCAGADLSPKSSNSESCFAFLGRRGAEGKRDKNTAIRELPLKQKRSGKYERPS